jgi:hypothetical protein
MCTWTTSKCKVLLLPGILILVAGIAGFRNVGRWLVHEDALSPADAIFVLSGGTPWRAEEAARVFRRGYAPEVWVSRPASPANERQEKSERAFDFLW